MTKTIKKWMIEEKIPVDRRGLLPVVADAAGAIAVYGLGVDADREARPNGTCLCIRIGSVGE